MKSPNEKEIQYRKLLAEKIKKLRIERGISKEKMAIKYLDIAASTYHKKEKGITAFTDFELREIKKILNISFDDISID